MLTPVEVVVYSRGRNEATSREYYYMKPAVRRMLEEDWEIEENFCVYQDGETPMDLLTHRKNGDVKVVCLSTRAMKAEFLMAIIAAGKEAHRAKKENEPTGERKSVSQGSARKA